MQMLELLPRIPPPPGWTEAAHQTPFLCWQRHLPKEGTIQVDVGPVNVVPLSPSNARTVSRVVVTPLGDLRITVRLEDETTETAAADAVRHLTAALQHV